ncbi:hypothetical protein LP109_09430 [Moraxella bovis]|uniref:Uncharacterized protein n=1 Tax=Moraxella bovis TaxID=476 RepID=A0A097J9U4_MORBO|nr:hypothetical protein [Moraxella bovis]AIT76555.1 hypothetical protein [Moraxella bovis]OOR89871.1 hypothetical protein B0182_06900 [Moraxella bovis]UZA15877.1 hypothetical protein LP109_09430 [Moraxella bovis]
MLIPVTKEHIITADKLATIRELYEFRRGGYYYNNQNNPIHQRISELHDIEIQSQSNLLTGILFEICLFETISETLRQRLREQDYHNDTEISSRMRQMNFSYGLTIGRVDDGYDYLIDRANTPYLIDVKMYGTRLFTNQNQVQNYNLFVDARQFNRNIATQYVQGFLIDNNNSLSIYVAGWTDENQLEYMENRNNCYAISVRDLNQIGTLIDIIYQNG